MKKLGYFLVFLAGVLPVGLYSQSSVTAGAIRGAVSDKSGAIVPGASIVLLSQNTGEKLTRVTNEAGIFVFPSQPVGIYTLQATAPGFQQERVGPLDVQVGQTLKVNLRLQPGTGSESINVSGESPLLQTEDSTQSSVVNRGLLEGLPLSGRRFLDFALLVPNATPHAEPRVTAARR